MNLKTFPPPLTKINWSLPSIPKRQNSTFLSHVQVELLIRDNNDAVNTFFSEAFLSHLVENWKASSKTEAQNWLCACCQGVLAGLSMRLMANFQAYKLKTRGAHCLCQQIRSTEGACFDCSSVVNVHELCFISGLLIAAATTQVMMPLKSQTLAVSL